MSPGPLIVQSDRTVLLETGHPDASDARHELAIFAELERAPEHIHTYRITRLGLHLSREDRVLRISSTFFTEWMAKSGNSRKIFLDRMEKEYGIEMKPGRLGSGTDLVSALEQLVVIDMNHPKLSQIIE